MGPGDEHLGAACTAADLHHIDLDVLAFHQLLAADLLAQMSLMEARAKYGRVDLGGTVNIPVDNVEFGRIAAGNGKQVIISGRTFSGLF